MAQPVRSSASYGVLALRILLGCLFIAHLYWKFAILKGGFTGWWNGLLHNGYAPYVPYYVASVEFAGAILLIPGILTRYVAVYAIPMMLGAAQFWAVRKGFYFTGAGCEMPLTWAILLGIQALLGDGPFALVKSPDLRSILGRRK